ncbi:MAG: dethiobiotin synthase [Candidatus Marinamargulisbacteria bacterium]
MDHILASDVLNHSVICITGTGTGVGKTIVTGLLGHVLAKDRRVVTQKWVQSGDLSSPDIATHDQLMGGAMDLGAQKDRQVYSFSDAVSPHLAAKLAHQSIDPTVLAAATQRLTEVSDTVLVETSGGIMVPLTETVVTGDLVASMALPTILVIPNQLGAINHSLLSAAYLAQKRIPILGFIMNYFSSSLSSLSADNPAIIASLSGLCHLGTVKPI